jgi:methylenetetrahydrofolate dehydrogenase (NADP+) / methenyltetrahydrofolate cyclohydrolase
MLTFASMILMDGKEVAASIKEKLKIKTAERRLKGLKQPHLAALLIGDNTASQTYVNSKVKTCHEIGFISTLYTYSSDITELEILRQIDELNANPDIDGILVQLPLPKHINEQNIIRAISPDKDVDGFHPVSMGRLVQDLPSFKPATPLGILKLLEFYKIETKGKHVVVVGRSNIVGRPMSIMLSQNHKMGNATVTLCHSSTTNLAHITLQADILVAAIGKSHFITADMVKQGAVVVDVGINRYDDASRKTGYRLVGDVDFEAVKQKTSFITPVPGGVGPMTIAGLMINTLEACQRRDG